MEQLIKYLFLLGMVLLVVAGVMWQSLIGVVVWKVAISFLVLSIGAKLIWLKK